ncbi:MAG TPA: hypothetical protein PLD88_12395, partial [Candidatus Berkiella sp.]|nr:hypothetical protein [Candidatus Berkiella sp.]
QHDLFGLYFYPRLRLGLSADGTQFFLAQSEKTNTSQLSAVTLADKQLRVLGGQQNADICDVLLEPQYKTPLAYAVNHQRKVWFGLDKEIEQEIRFLTTFDDGDMDIVSQTKDNQSWIIAYVRDNGPVGYYLYHRNKQSLHHLFDSHSSFSQYAFTCM